MNTYYINSATGSDANDGSAGSPWATLDFASSQISLPATIQAIGDFDVQTWSAPLASYASPLRIVGTGIATTSITTALSQSILRFGVTVTDLSYHPNGGGISSQGFAFVDCHISRGPAQAAHVFYGIGAAKFLRCTIDHGSSYGQLRLQSNAVLKQCHLVGDIRIQAVTGSTVLSRCVMRNNSSFASQIGSQGGYIVADHCTIHDCNDASPVVTITSSGRVDISNSVIVRVGDSIARTVVGTETELSTIDGVYLHAVPDFGAAEGFAIHSTPTILAEDPYSGSATGDYTPSDELAAIVGSDGLTPGHIQAGDGARACTFSPFQNRAIA